MPNVRRMLDHLFFIGIYLPHLYTSKMKKIVPLLVLILFLNACAGRDAPPVMVMQRGDETKSCKSLAYELKTLQSDIDDLLPKTNKDVQNVALGAAGYFLLVPWFFIDFKNAEKIEYEAYRQRYDHLTSIAISKNCEIDIQKYPSAEDIIKNYKDSDPSKETANKTAVKKTYAVGKTSGWVTEP